MRAYIRRYLDEVSQALNNIDLDEIEAMVSLLHSTRKEGGCVFFFGNGACAALADHMATDIGKSDRRRSLEVSRMPVSVYSLSANNALITALGNDLAYEHVYAEQLAGRIRPADLAVGLSASGSSANVLLGLEEARATGARTACYTGMMSPHPPILKLADVAVCVPSDQIDQIEDSHVAIHHAILRRYLEAE
jgi:D-sedoheptulose 7-phosphate isomerase